MQHPLNIPIFLDSDIIIDKHLHLSLFSLPAMFQLPLFLVLEVLIRIVIFLLILTAELQLLQLTPFFQPPLVPPLQQSIDLLSI